MATGISKKSRQPNGDLVVLGQGQGTVAASPRPSSSGSKIVGRPLSRPSSSGGFEVLPGDGSFADSRPSSATSDGRGSSGRRSYTPSKQVTLPTVKRKEESEDNFGKLDWREHEQLEEKKNMHLNSGDGSSLNKNMNNLSMNHKTPVMNGDIAQESSDDDEESSSEEEEVKAPNELMMEFVTCMMQEDYVNALKLCKMILIYEPDNAEAKEFLPVIEEKMQLDAEGEEEESGESGDEEDDDDDDDEGDSDDDDDDDSDSDDSSEDSAEDDEKKTEKEATTVVFNMPS